MNDIKTKSGSGRQRGFEVVSAYAEKGVALPARKTGSSAGYDIQSAEDVILAPHRVTLVPTGLKAYMQPDEYLGLHVRSGFSIKNQVSCINSQGIIDADYYNNPDNEGEIFFQIINLSPFPIMLHKGDAIGQGIIKKYITTVDDEANGIRSGGFGSTDMGHSDESAMASAT